MRIDTLARLAVVTMALAAIACTPPQSRPNQSQSHSQVTVTVPVIDSVHPDSVGVPYGGVVEVTLYGKGFVPGNPGMNTVNFAGASLSSIAGSADGGRIVFVIPDQISAGGESPPIRLASGSYPVSVKTAAGASNVVTIRVYR